MKVYISGQISGMPIEQAETNFRTAKKEVIAMGHEPVNPFNNGLPHTATWAEHMVKDIEMLMRCDAIFLLPNWKNSKGARIEMNIAREIGLIILGSYDNNYKSRIACVKNEVQSVTGIEFEKFISRSRNRHVMQALTLFIAVLRLHTTCTQNQIGNLINRDHSTINHHEKKYQNYLETDKDFRQLAESIIKRLPWL